MSAKEIVYRSLTARSVVKDFIAKYGDKLRAAGVLDKADLTPEALAAPRPRLSDKPKKVGRLGFPEDSLIRELYKRHPEVREIPLDILSGELHPAKKFGLLQLEFIERLGLQREEAFKKAFEQLEMGKYVEAIRQKASLEPDIIAVIQQEEAQVLNEALRRRVQDAAPRAADGPEPGPGPQAAARAEPGADAGVGKGEEEGGTAEAEASGGDSAARPDPRSADTATPGGRMRLVRERRLAFGDLVQEEERKGGGAS